MKRLRVAGANTVEQANRYLDEEYLAWWERELTLDPTNDDDAPRELDKSHDLAASLSPLGTRQMGNDYTLRWVAALSDRAAGGHAGATQGQRASGGAAGRVDGGTPS